MSCAHSNTSFNCKEDFNVLQGNLNGVAYGDNVLNVHVVPILMIIHWMTGRSLSMIRPDCRELAC